MKSLPDANLKANTSFDERDWIAYATSDLDAVRRVNDTRRNLSHSIDPAPLHAG